MAGASCEAAGFPPAELDDAVERAGLDYRLHRPGRPLSVEELSALAASVLGPGALSDRKVFARRDVIVAVAPAPVRPGPRPSWTEVADRVLRDPDAVPAGGVPRATERAYATASVLATETGHRRGRGPRGGAHRRGPASHPTVAEAASTTRSRALGPR